LKLLIKNGRTILLTKGLHSIFHIPSEFSLSDFLPKNSVIIIDQIDFQMDPLPADIRSYLTELATDSSNSGTFKIVLCVSDAKVIRFLENAAGERRFILSVGARTSRGRTISLPIMLPSAFLKFLKSTNQNFANLQGTATIFPAWWPTQRSFHRA